MTALATDNFDRANAGTLGTNWTDQGESQQFGITSNKAQPVTDANDCASNYNAITWPADQYSKGAFTATTGYTASDGVGVGLRMSTVAATLTYYRVIFNHQASSNVDIAKKVGGTFTSIVKRTASWTDGDILYGEINGTTLQAKINGVDAGLSTTDSAISSGRAGITYSAQSASEVSTLNDWEGGDLVAPGTPIAPTFVAAGTFVSASTNGATLAPGLPAGWTAGDLHVLVAARKDNTAMTALSGWTQIASLSGNNGTGLRTEVWTRRALAADTAPTVTFGTGTTLRCAQIFGVRRAALISDPITSSRLANASSATVSTSDITPPAGAGPTLGLFVFTYPSGPTSATQPTGWSTFTVARSGASGIAIGYATETSVADGTAYGAPTTVASGQTNSVNDGLLLGFAAEATVPVSWARLLFGLNTLVRL